MAARYKIALQYRGTNFHGYQKQNLTPQLSHSQPNPRTVQGLLEEALTRLQPQKKALGEEILTAVSGRTDVGVHALCNFASVDLTRIQRKTGQPMQPFRARDVKNSLNDSLRRLGSDLVVPFVHHVDENFNARFSAIERTYEYKIVNSEKRTNLGHPFEFDLHWDLAVPLDIAKMEEACKVFVGYHDFTTFCAQGQQETNLRTIDSVHFEVSQNESTFYNCRSPMGPFPRREIIIRVRARSFLWHQVRKIVGGIIHVGSGKVTVGSLKSMLEAKDPGVCPPMAPAHGLYLVNVKFVPHSILDSSEQEDL